MSVEQPWVNFFVNSTNDVDDGVYDAAHCSLREAINAANANTNAPVLDFIGFIDLGPGPHTISPLSGLPPITDTIEIRGTLVLGKPGIELDGTNAGVANGLQFLGDNNVIKFMVINRFDGDGIHITAVSHGNLVEGNFIGTDLSGTIALGNSGRGVRIFSSNNVVGKNTIADNSEGVQISTAGNVVHGNFIGTNRFGSDLGNLNAGVVVAGAASDNFIGGFLFNPSFVGNIIAYNGGAGITVDPASTGTSMLFNSIYRNGGLGIDLGNDGVTANDLGDPDMGANHLQNHPEITSVTFDTATQQITIEGTLNSTPNTNFILQFFSTPFQDISGHGEGRTVIGEAFVVTDANGNNNFSVMFSVPLPPCVTAKASENTISTNTSEFSLIFGPVGDDTLPNGILDVVQDNANPQAEITDVGLGGTTTGGITSRGHRNGLKVWDAVNPDLPNPAEPGVHIALDPDAPSFTIPPTPPVYSFRMCPGDATSTAFFKAQFVNCMRHLVTAAARQARSLAPGARPTRWNQLR